MSLNIHRVSDLDWTLTAYAPYEWQMGHCETLYTHPKPDVDTIAAAVPGSVQKALLDAGKVPDWNIGMNARLLEWIENRHWLYETHLPDTWFEPGKKYMIRCEGLDHQGQIYLNDRCIYEFANAHVEHHVEIPSEMIVEGNNTLRILFECPPRWLGGLYYSSKVRGWKPRFYYTWDWTSRVVQIGIHGDIYIEELPENRIEEIVVNTDYHIEPRKGSMLLEGVTAASSGCTVVAHLYDHDTIIASKSISAAIFNQKGLAFEQLDIQPWWPHTLGSQKLYYLEIQLIDEAGQLCDRSKKRIGFKNVQWLPCRNAPKNADPWLCCINGKELFLQGVNWTPIRPNFADLQREDYEKRVALYKSIGMNIFRMWGGATLENASFYELCDELGLLVWQEFPLSGSGLENYPPDDEKMVDEFGDIVRSYLTRRHHHPCLLMWGGGNELTTPDAVPLGLEHPMLMRASDIIAQKDKQHRFVATSPTGPTFCALKDNYGKGIHWDIHGPWNVIGGLDEEWRSYWANDDSLFRSEQGAPGPSSADMIGRYAGDCDVMPCKENPLWRRTGWWLEIDQYIKEMGGSPESLEAYVEWGQGRQATILTEALKACRGRFPECGGYIIWMGHDSFPCTANTSIVDFEGNPKPAATILAKILNES